MRLISQNGAVDIPYDLAALVIEPSFRNGKKIWNVVAFLPGLIEDKSNRKIIMASYSKAEKAVSIIHLLIKELCQHDPKAYLFPEDEK